MGSRAALLEAKLRASPTVPVFLSLAVGGVLPLHPQHAYLPSTGRLLRSTAPYCAVVMALVLYSTMSVLLLHLPSVVQARVLMLLYTRLKCVNAVLTITPILFIPKMWVGMRGLAARVVDFCNYEITHEALTGRRLDWSWHFRRNQAVLAVLYALLVAVFVSGKIVEPERPCHVPSYVCSMHFQSNLSLWYISWISQIRFAAEDILKYLQESKEHPCTTVRRSRRLWVDLREILEENRTLKNLIFLIHGYLFFVVTLSLYQVLHYGRQGETTAALAQSVINLAMFFQIFVFCNETHKCTATMNKTFTTALDRFSLKVEDEETRKAINLFYLSIAANPAKASLAGFAKCDRPLLSSVVASTVTYLVVLVQFQTMERERYFKLIKVSYINSSEPLIIYLCL
ncbi:Gustatory receptor 9 [Frankliniella occidentalis]|nr:Gustatory receptor 9 [Frankliniella occidentalis]